MLAKRYLISAILLSIVTSTYANNTNPSIDLVHKYALSDQKSTNKDGVTQGPPTDGTYGDGYGAITCTPRTLIDIKGMKEAIYSQDPKEQPSFITLRCYNPLANPPTDSNIVYALTDDSHDNINGAVYKNSNGVIQSQSIDDKQDQYGTIQCPNNYVIEIWTNSPDHAYHQSQSIVLRCTLKMSANTSQ